MIVIVGIDLVTRQAPGVGSWCTPCSLTALISVLLVILAYDELRGATSHLRRVWRRTRSRRAVCRALLCRDVGEADATSLTNAPDPRVHSTPGLPGSTGQRP